METVLAARCKGIPDPSHEVGIPKNIYFAESEVALIFDAFADERFKNCSTYQEQIRVLYELFRLP